MNSKNYWSREEMIVCLGWYGSLTKEQKRTPPPFVLETLSKKLGRSKGSISLRFANFNSVDPLFTQDGLKGMSGGGAHVLAIWNEFSDNEGTLQPQILLRELSVLVPIEMKETT